LNLVSPNSKSVNVLIRCFEPIMCINQRNR